MKGKRESGAASRGVEWVALGVAAVVLALEIGRVLVEFGLRYTDEDQTIVWYAARDYAQLVFHEPFFYGQSYNPLYECLPAALLVALGVEPWVATPVASAMIASMVWWLFAAMAWRRGARAIAVGLLVLPTAMAPTYPMLAGHPTKSIGVAFVVAGLALVWNRPSRARFVGFGWFAALGVTTNPNSALLALPVGLWALFTHGRVRRFYAFAGLGAALGLLLYGAGKLFYRLHPAYDLHRVKSFPPSLAWLLDGIQHLDRHWGQVSPLSSGWLMLAALTIAALLHLRRPAPPGGRTHTHLAVGLCGVALAVLSLALGRVHFGAPSVFFSYARMYVALPALLGFLVLLHAEKNRPLRASAAICATLAALAIAGGVYRHHRLPDVVAHARTEPARSVTPRVRDELFDECRRLDAAVPEDALVVFLGSDGRGNGRAYGCGVLLHGRLDTLFPYYERRTWRLYEESRRPRGELFLTELRNDPCGALRGRFESCELVERSLGLFRIGFTPQPAIPVLRQLGLQVRPFQ